MGYGDVNRLPPHTSVAALPRRTGLLIIGVLDGRPRVGWSRGVVGHAVLLKNFLLKILLCPNGKMIRRYKRPVKNDKKNDKMEESWWKVLEKLQK